MKTCKSCKCYKGIEGLKNEGSLWMNLEIGASYVDKELTYQTRRMMMLNLILIFNTFLWCFTTWFITKRINLISDVVYKNSYDLLKLQAKVEAQEDILNKMRVHSFRDRI